MLYLLLLICPLFNFIFSFFFGRLLGFRGSCIMTFFNMLCTLVASCYLLYNNITSGNICILTLGEWVRSGSLVIDYCLVYDSLSLFMCFLVAIVSFVVHIYSFDYMYSDPYIIRFLAYLSLFTFFMFILVLSNNLVLFLLGWEGIGLCSYLLIGFWYTRVDAAKAAMKAIIYNRIGDIGYILGMALIFSYTQCLDLYVIYSFLPYFCQTIIVLGGFVKIYLLDLIILFFFIGVIGKSAQMGLHVWLVDAMEGPTPVSALIHAATLVTAGVFLLIRLSFIIEFTVIIYKLIIILGFITALFASIIGLIQNDIKSIIAYSTCSQLGYMVGCCGLSGYNIAFFHLINHGFFKALLFLSAGMVIHFFMDEQDIRKMGGLYQLLPLCYLFFIIGSLSLIGLPFLSGFYSKDLILEFTYSAPFYFSNILYHFILLGACFTSFYSTRLLYYVFIAKPNGFRHYYKALNINGYSNVYYFLFILLFFSVFSGYIFKDIFSGQGSSFFNYVIYISEGSSRYSYDVEYFLYSRNISVFTIKSLPLLYIIFGSLSFILISCYPFNILTLDQLFIYMYIYIFNGFFFNYVYIRYFKFFFFEYAFLMFIFDKSFLENCSIIYFKEFFIKWSLVGYEFLLYNNFNSYVKYLMYLLLYFISIVIIFF